MNHIKRLWGHYLALLFLVILLVVTLTWFYHYFWNHFGSEIALVALGLMLVGELILVVRGVVHAHRIHRILREQIDKSGHLPISEETEKPMMFKVFDMDLQSRTNVAPVEMTMDPVQQELQRLLTYPKKRRGKQARFPISQIQSAVLEWEQRDPAFTAETLEEFLERKFGSSGDGILLMSPSTFYDWRRRILKELADHRPPASKAEHSQDRLLSEPPSRSFESIS